jgi:hypothetical protein
MVNSLAGFTWRKSSRSNGSGHCVELALTAHVAAIRDSKNPEGGALVLTSAAWAAFSAAVRA